MQRTKLETRLLVGEVAQLATSPTKSPYPPTGRIKSYLNKCVKFEAGWPYILALFATLTGGCNDQLPPPPTPKVTLLMIAADVSGSSGTNQAAIAELRCTEITARVHQALNLPDIDQLEVAVLATGDTKLTGGEPKPLLVWTRFALQYQVFGKQVSPHDQQQAFLKQVEKNCRDNLQVGDSPVFLTWQRSLEGVAARKVALTQHGEEVDRSFLTMLSDHRETSYPVVTRRLATVAEALRRGKALPKRPENLPTLSLSGLTAVGACGVSEHVADATESALYAQAVVIVWKEILGAQWVFDPTCPRDPALVATTKGGGQS